MAYFKHIDDEFDFGKYKGLSLSDVMDIDSEYVTWCMLTVSEKNCGFIILDEAMEELIAIYVNFIVTVKFEKMRYMRMTVDYI